MTLKIATAQLSAKEFGLEKIEEYLRRADKERVDVICFPEGYMNGYTRDESQARKIGLDLSSTKLQAILEKLNKFRAMAIIGVIEIEDSILFNTAIVVRDGRLIGKYRKTHPQEDIYQAGTEYPVFEIKGYKFGINICYDANFPEASKKLIDQGAEVLFYPLNNELKKESAEKWRYKPVENLIQRARETNAWVVSSDVIIETNETTGYGCTVIVNPEGKVVEKVAELEEGLLLSEIQRVV
jgi:predicted amidohydrolase